MENDENEDYYVCADCCKDIYLKSYVNKNAKHNAVCTICLKECLSLKISENIEMSNFCRFLIRYHFPEYEYNTHWGGDDLPSQFYVANPIISHEFQEYDSRYLEIEEFLYTLFNLHDLDSENPIALYYGHDSYGRGLFPYAIKDEKSEIWSVYKKELRESNYYLLEEEARKKFSPLLEELRYRIPLGDRFFRARIGYVDDTIDVGFSERKVSIKSPYRDGAIGAPPISKAKAGRANRHGVSFLYLASNTATAVGEVRPHPGHYVSLGGFISSRDIHVVDLRFIDLYKYYGSQELLEMFKFLRDVSYELSIPIVPEEQENYLVTQFVSDIIRQLGFDGLLFNSSVSSGYNLVVFNPGCFRYDDDGGELIKVSSLKFDYKKTIYQIDNWLEKVREE